MEIKNKKVLVFGGWGLVGMAICRRILEEKPEMLIVHSLTQSESEEACDTLKEMPQPDVEIKPCWGNIFVRDAMQGLGRDDILENAVYRNWLIDDTLEVLTDDLLKRFYLYQTIETLF